MTAYQRDDYIRYRIERAKETLVEVEKHIENCFWNTAVNRLYYACFYAVSALLLKNNIEVSSHSGAVSYTHLDVYKRQLQDRQQ